MRFQAACAASLYTSRGLRKYLTTQERSRFIAAADACTRAELRTLCLTLAYCGCRLSESLNLTVGSVEAEAGFIAFRCLKKRGGSVVIREVPVPVVLIDALEAVHGISSADRNARLWTWSRGHAWQLIKSVMASARIPEGVHATPKGLRHGFAVKAVQSGAPVSLVQRWLGHANVATTVGYLQAIGAEEIQFIARTWE